MRRLNGTEVPQVVLVTNMVLGSPFSDFGVRMRFEELIHAVLEPYADWGLPVALFRAIILNDSAPKENQANIGSKIDRGVELLEVLSVDETTTGGRWSEFGNLLRELAHSIDEAFEPDFLGELERFLEELMQSQLLDSIQAPYPSGLLPQIKPGILFGNLGHTDDLSG